MREVIEEAKGVVGLDAEVIAPEEVAHVEIEDEQGKGNSLGIAKGFSVWEWFEGKEKPALAKARKDGAPVTDPLISYKWREGEACPGAWRIKEFLGCQAAKWKDKDNPRRRCPVVANPPASPDLLVIDDLGLGFADHRECWPPALAAGAGPVLIKATPPFDRELWRELFAGNRVANVTVVVSAAALRDAGAQLTRGLSWDQTIREVKR